MSVGIQYLSFVLQASSDEFRPELQVVSDRLVPGKFRFPAGQGPALQMLDAYRMMPQHLRPIIELVPSGYEHMQFAVLNHISSYRTPSTFFLVDPIYGCVTFADLTPPSAYIALRCLVQRGHKLIDEEFSGQLVIKGPRMKSPVYLSRRHSSAAQHLPLECRPTLAPFSKAI